MNTIGIMNLGAAELIVILSIILVLFGAKKLPGLARGMGQALREFHKGKDQTGPDSHSVAGRERGTSSRVS